MLKRLFGLASVLHIRKSLLGFCPLCKLISWTQHFIYPGLILTICYKTWTDADSFAPDGEAVHTMPSLHTYANFVEWSTLI